MVPLYRRKKNGFPTSTALGCKSWRDVKQGGGVFLSHEQTVPDTRLRPHEVLGDPDPFHPATLSGKASHPPGHLAAQAHCYGDILASGEEKRIKKRQYRIPGTESWDFRL